MSLADERLCDLELTDGLALKDGTVDLVSNTLATH